MAYHAEKHYNSPRTKLEFFTGFAWDAHPDKRHNGGEDAFFCCRNAMAVFDGVGGWAERGVDPGLYSLALQRLSKEYMDRNGPHVVEALNFAVRRNHEIGTSTACVVGLVNGRYLHSVNVGDSGFVIIRGNEIVYRSTEQTSSFNYPYQLGTNSRFSVEDGSTTSFALQLGDWIIMGTDGLWDNVFKTDVTHYVARHDCLGPGDMARGLLRLAKMVAYDEKAQSPFARQAKKAGRSYRGGKLDDITVVCARVVRVESRR